MSWLFQPLLPAVAQQQAASGSAYTLTADAGSFALTGQDAGLHVSRLLATDAASFALAGQNVSLRRVFTLTADAGGFVLSGQDAGLRASRLLATGDGSFVFSGQAVTIITAQPVPIRLAVQKAVYEAAQTALAALAVPVYDHPPHSQAAPFVVFDLHQTVPLDGADLYGYTHQFYLSVWSSYRGAREVETILAALRSGLHNQTVTLETGTCALCQVSDQRSQRDADGITYQGAMTVSLVTVLPEVA